LRSGTSERSSPRPVAQLLEEVWRERQPLCLGLFLFGLILWTFRPAVYGEFVCYDDPTYVTENAQVQHGLQWGSIKWAFSNSEGANWLPLTWLSHMLDCQIFGLKAWGHHLSSILLHALNTLLAFAVLRRMTGATGRSFVVALFFGLHPLRVESVAWVAERKDVLSTCFFLLTLGAYARYAEGRRGKGESRRKNAECRMKQEPQVGHASRSILASFLLAFIFFALGLLSKPMLVTLPFVLLLLDYWPLRRWPREGPWALAAEKIPFFLAAGIVSVVTFVVQKHGGAVTSALPFAARTANAVVAYCSYLGKLFWPVDLAVFYPLVDPLPTAWVLLAGCLLLALSLLVLAFRRRFPFGLVGWLWFVGTLVPVIGLIQVGGQSMADRYSYIPSLGIMLAVVWGAHELTKGRAWQTVGACAAAAAGAFLCFALTRAQVRVWRDSESLFRHALLVTKDNYVAHNNLGTVLDKQGHREEAVEEFRHASQDKPDAPEAHKNLGAALSGQGRLEEAAAHLQEAIRLRPGYAEAHFNLGSVLQTQGRLAEAIRQYQQALRLNPRHADAQYNLGLALEQSGRPDEAAAAFQAAQRLQPTSPEACNNLGVALERNGRLDDAAAQYLAAIKLKPDYALAHFNLGAVRGQQGQLDQAIAEFQQTLRLDPRYAQAQTNLALALEFKRNLDKH
jgi:protein O-mannosyl-transferase